MRVITFIFSCSFLLLFAYLSFEPLLRSPLSVEQPSCAKSKCDKGKTEEPEGDCRDRGCNPLVPCAMGSCCYMTEESFSGMTVPCILTRRPLPANDNSLTNHDADCWHPPEVKT